MEHRIRLIALLVLAICVSVSIYAQNIITIAGGATGHGSYWGDGGPATAAAFNLAAGIAIDTHKNLYIADGFNHRVRKIDATTGIVTTFAGTGIAGYNGDNIPATSAQIHTPTYVAIDKHGNVYIQEPDNYRIRKVNSTTGIISTFAGTGIWGFSGDGGQATTAKIIPGPITCDPYGNLYVADVGNRRIRKINTSGIITTIAGNGISGNSGDGGLAINAKVNIPLSICSDSHGNIYFQDSSASVRKINVSNGIITRVAGLGDNIHSPYSGDGNIATNSHLGPFGVATDIKGNIYIADGTNNRIEKVDLMGILHTVVGTGTNGFSGDGGAATAARVYQPRNIAFDLCDNLYIIDFGNKRIRKVTFNPPPCTYLSVDGQSVKNEVSTYPNPANELLNITSPGLSHGEVVLCNMLGQAVLMEQVNSKQTVVNIKHLPPGIYLLALTDGEGRRTVHKIVKE